MNIITEQLHDPNQFRLLVHIALRSWHSISDENALQDLLLVKGVMKEQGINIRLATNIVLQKGLDDLTDISPQNADILRRRFLDRLTAREISSQLNLSEDSINRLQRKSLDLLAKIIWEKEKKIREQRIMDIELRMPAPTYTKLFGFDELSQTIAEHLVRENNSFIVSIIGIGGSGKTSLADLIIRNLLPQFVFDDVLVTRDVKNTESLVSSLYWSLPHIPAGNGDTKKLYRVQRYLKNNRCLVLVDDVDDFADINSIFLTMKSLASPSKFLITSRYRFPQNIATYMISELSADNALALIRNQADCRNLPELSKASDEELLPLYMSTGGNPLALKLAVSMAEILPLTTIIEDFRSGLPGSVSELYNHVYRNFWASLSEQSRVLLSAISLSGKQGIAFEQLEAMSGLSREHVSSSIQELASFSLIEFSGSMSEKRYSTHSLTNRFLDTELVKTMETSLQS